MNRFLVVLIALLFTSLISSCARAPRYTAPEAFNNTGTENFTVTLSESYDQVWNKLIKFFSQSDFTINNYEKDSGLITLSFNPSEPTKYVTGGRLSSYRNDYVDLLVRRYNGALQGEMNVFLIKAPAGKTKVTVNAKYVFNASARRKMTWAFNSGSCDKKNGIYGPAILCPTHKAEADVLNALTPNGGAIVSKIPKEQTPQKNNDQAIKEVESVLSTLKNNSVVATHETIKIIDVPRTGRKWVFILNTATSMDREAEKVCSHLDLDGLRYRFPTIVEVSRFRRLHRNTEEFKDYRNASVYTKDMCRDGTNRTKCLYSFMSDFSEIAYSANDIVCVSR